MCNSLSAHFYCYQHAGLDAPSRNQRVRKRSFGDKDLIAKLAPIIAPLKPPDVTSTPAASACHVDGMAQVKVTPERIEFDIDSEWEESELEQTSHNLNASFAFGCRDDDDNTDSE